MWRPGDVGRNQQILQLYRDGATQVDIGARFGITESRVCQILHVDGGYTGKDRIQERIRQRKAREKDDRARKAQVRRERDSIIREMWLAGALTDEIGERIGLERSVVGRYAKRMGLPQRRRGGWGSSRHSRGPLTPDELAARRLSRQAREETEPEALRERSGRRCICGAEPEVDCICGRRRCEDHAYMTSDGVRCEVCFNAA